jgi:exodeoxyribonuclease VII large subunit
MENILSVAELTFAIKKKLETTFPNIWVRGEITNFKEQASGHLYFTLKDAEAQISAVLFRGNTKGLAKMPKNGDQVIVKGELNVYPPRGNYQIIVRELQFAGVGELLLKLHELKMKLEAKGWFEASRKKPLPKMPKTIGVVTSPTGAVIQDILTILNRRFSGLHLILNPVKVQGEGAAAEIAKAIEEFNRYQMADVLIIGRGGGSLEDLWAFNEEIVATAIFNSKIPVISAVGHETDFSIADFVADVRAPTPSAAAELVVAEKQHHLDHLTLAQKRLQHALRHPIEQAAQKLDDIGFQITSALQQKIGNKKIQLMGLRRQAEMLKPSNQISISKQKLLQLAAHLRSIDPRNLLTKGYCILFHEKKHSVIFSSQELEKSDTLEIILHDGKRRAQVL